MTKKSPSDHESLIPLSDLFLLCKQGKKTIFLGMFLFACFMVGYTLITPPEYTAHATFREKGKSSAGVTSSSLSMLLGGTMGGSNNSEAVSMMKSRTLLEQLAKKLNMQASLNKKETNLGNLSTFIKNLKIEYAVFKKKQGPILPDSQKVISAVDVAYAGEVPIGMKLKFFDDDTFQVSPPPEGRSPIGKIGEPFVTSTCCFTIIRHQDHPLTKQEYILGIEPLDNVVQRLLLKIKIETDIDDKALLKLQYTHTNRHEAAEALNTLMALYQKHLSSDQQRVLQEQVQYLKTRHNKMQTELLKMMENHAEKLSLDLAKTGFPDTHQAMQFLAAAQQEYTRNVLGIDLELKRLQQVEQDGSSYYERYASEGGGQSVINGLVSQIRVLKQQADSIELALREALIENQADLKEQEDIALQFVELTQIHHATEEAKQILASLDAGEMPNTNLRLYHDKRYMVKNWCDRLSNSQDNLRDYAGCVDSFSIYLKNLLHLFHVHEKAIQERLTHQQLTPLEFQGIDLHTAKELYIEYSRELHKVEAEITQNEFIIEQMQDPDFEVSSLSTILRDSIAERMVAAAGHLLLQLKDQNNRSLKEQERLKSELALQKGFLANHVKQTVQLLQIREKLLRLKIKALQSSILGLIQQEVSILQEHLNEHIKTRIKNLLQERELIEQHQAEIQQEMAKLPSKWVSEKMIDQQMEVNKKMVEEITRLVESKNITSNLELIQSAPVDAAIPPVRPRTPRLLFFTMAGALLGGFLAISWLVVRALSTGFIVTAMGLKLANQHISGALSLQSGGLNSKKTLLDKDLETLRRIVVFLTASPNSSGKGKTALLMLGHHVDYSKELATLMSKINLKVLLLPLSFDSISPEEDLPGLLQYLENQASQPKIKCEGTYDRIAVGGVSRFTSELLGLPQFNALLEKLKPQYDWILAITHAQLGSSEAEHLLNRFATAVITINGEVWSDLRACGAITEIKEEQKRISFVMTEED